MNKTIKKNQYIIEREDEYTGKKERTRIKAASDKEAVMEAFEVPLTVEDYMDQYELPTREATLAYLINEDMCGDISIYNYTKDEEVDLDQFRD